MPKHAQPRLVIVDAKLVRITRGVVDAALGNHSLIYLERQLTICQRLAKIGVQDRAVGLSSMFDVGASGCVNTMCPYIPFLAAQPGIRNISGP
jgi:hypothetical protein